MMESGETHNIQLGIEPPSPNAEMSCMMGSSTPAGHGCAHSLALTSQTAQGENKNNIQMDGA